MTFPWSDFFGMLGGVCLAVPAFKDKYYRWRREWQKTAATHTRFPRMRQTLSAAYEDKRAEYSSFDSVLLGVGAVFPIFTFLIKAVVG
jgi:hypothetical protein